MTRKRTLPWIAWRWSCRLPAVVAILWVGKRQLFDLAADPHEMHDLAENPRHAHVLTELCQLLREGFAALGDPLMAGAD